MSTAKMTSGFERKAYKRQEKPEPQANGHDTNPPFVIDFKPYAFPDPASIPARQWLFGRHYIRGVVSATIGAPGRLKSTTALTEIISMAVGRDLMSGELLPSGPLRAAYLNGEEEQDELDRRVAAVLQHFGVDHAACGNRLYVVSTRDKPFKVAELGLRGSGIIRDDVVDALKGWCDQNEIDVISIDPLISFHRVREIDNGDMDVVCKDAFGKIAGKNRSVDLVHHPRKPAPGEVNTTVDDARGASAIIGAVRLARVLNFMTTGEAGVIGIPEDTRRRHIKIENGKANPGPIGNAHWLKIEVELLPNGDEVACSTLWKLPNPFEKVVLGDYKVVQKVVQSAAFRTNSQSPDWLGWWMAENLPHLDIKVRYDDKPRGDRGKAEVARLNSILKTWKTNGVLDTEKRDDQNREKRDFYIVGNMTDEARSAVKPGGEDDEITIE
jgi:AAA domain